MKNNITRLFLLFLVANLAFIGASGQLDYGICSDSIGTDIENAVQADFEAFKAEIINLGIKEESTWLKINLPPTSGDKFLRLESVLIDSLFFYQVDEGKVISSDTTGVAFPMSSRQVKSPLFLFRLVPSENVTQAYIRVQSGKQLIIIPSIESIDSYTNKQYRADLFFSFYVGIMLVMFLYNLFVYFSVRDESYLYYVGYIFFVAATQLVLNGYGNLYVWPENSWIALRSTHFSGVASGIATIIFAGQYLHVKEKARWLYHLMRFYTLLYLIGLIAAIAGYFQFSFNLINFGAMFSIILLVGVVMLYRKGFKPAFFFLIAWTFFLLGVVVFVMKDYGAVPYNDFTRFALPVGSALEVVLLSFALADRINQLKREKEIEQEEKLMVLGENERIIKQQNAMLEAKVGERTRELATTNAELSTTLDNLKAAQAQLVDAEKMASLGQMTAGIAHELNNPINFVSGNISPLKRDIEDLLTVIGKYEEVEPNAESTSTQISEAKELARQLDVPFIRDEIQQLLNGIEVGASRTSAIVRGLRVFSRLDEDALKKADINECVISTIIILKSNFRGEVVLQEDLDPNLKEIMCFPGKLNQVFMNILNNAVQATGGQGRTREERIVSIATKQKENGVEIRIKDNGTGMPEEVKNKIFDPFFTTKGVGEGTGLGLSIVLGIINDHKGTIEVVTKEGEGTEFIINLPDNLS